MLPSRVYRSPELAKLLPLLAHPVSYLDFETFAPAIPIYVNTRPYERIPFQWSLDHADGNGSEEALSDALRKAANEWFSHTLYNRLNDKRSGAIVIIMQRLHEDDLVGHVIAQKPWEVVSFPAIAESDEVHRIETIWGPRCFRRQQGDALHPDREPLETLDRCCQINVYRAEVTRG